MIFRDGSEVQYEVASSLVSIVTRGSFKVVPSIELAWTSRPGWELRCAATVSPTSPWNLTGCRTTPLSPNYTLCHCPKIGTYAAMIVKVIHSVSYLLAFYLTIKVYQIRAKLTNTT